MALYVIDLMGDEDVIAIKPEDQEEMKKREEKRLEFLKELFKRAPQPQVIPIDV